MKSSTQPSLAGNTTKYVHKKQKTKQAQHQDGANNSRAKCITKLCQDDDRHENTPHLNKNKIKLNVSPPNM